MESYKEFMSKENQDIIRVELCRYIGYHPTTIAKLSEKIGITRQALSAWLLGKLTLRYVSLIKVDNFIKNYYNNVRSDKK